MSEIHQRPDPTTECPPVLTEACGERPSLQDRFCGECGGETRHARRVEGRMLITYLRCVFCGALTPLLEYDLVTREHRSLLEEP